MQSALFIGRFQPFHKGHLSVVEKILANNEKALIVIGSAQESRTDKNPLTANERETLIKEALKEKNIHPKNYKICKLDDIKDYANWSNYIHKKLPPFAKVYTGSKLVIACLEGKYSDKKSFPKKIPKIIKLKRNLPIHGTNIREKILKNENWEILVPTSVAKILKKWKLTETGKA